MNSLMNKVMLTVLILVLTVTVFSGCGAESTKAIAGPIHTPGSQVLQNGSVQPLTTDGTAPEATEPEATEPEATEPEATEPEATEPNTEAPAEGGFLQEFWARFLQFFDWFRIRVNFVFDVLMKQ
ncbi:MAG: hypothetical protein E7461_06955 [Ruminococcaceae bacterium]|nr:hypothetical protein [Oscillospiraceae bacterium]